MDRFARVLSATRGRCSSAPRPPTPANRRLIAGYVEQRDRRTRTCAPVGVARPDRWVLDAVIVAAVVGLGSLPSRAAASDASRAGSVAVALALPLLWRRRWPVAVFAAIAGIAFVQWLVDVKRGRRHRPAGRALHRRGATRRCRSRSPRPPSWSSAIVLASVRWGANGTALSAIAGLVGLATAAARPRRQRPHRRALLAALEDRAAAAGERARPAGPARRGRRALADRARDARRRRPQPLGHGRARRRAPRSRSTTRRRPPSWRCATPRRTGRAGAGRDAPAPRRPARGTSRAPHGARRSRGSTSSTPARAGARRGPADDAHRHAARRIATTLARPAARRLPRSSRRR